MGHSYTPGLTVTDRTLVRKRRLLPIPGKVLVEVGERVTPDRIVARTELPGKVHPLNLANLLGVAPDEMGDYLVKQPGDTVQKDEVVAENKPFIKWFKTDVRSPIAGTLESLSPVTGQVLLREAPTCLDLLGYIDGVVVEVHPSQGVTVETACTYIQGIFGVGGETWGELVMGVTTPDAMLAPEHVTPAMNGKIVVAGSFLGVDTMKRAQLVGVAGLVVGGIHDKDLRELLGYDLGVAITGTEQIGLTLLLTEGFGTIPMAAKTFRLLTAHAGQKAAISGATQIRAGVIRPEIIIARAAGETAPASTAAATAQGGLKIGAQVRVIRDPQFGKIGQVVGLPAELTKIETESEVRVLQVQFADQTIATIPRANVEAIEG